MRPQAGSRQGARGMLGPGTAVAGQHHTEPHYIAPQPPSLLEEQRRPHLPLQSRRQGGLLLLQPRSCMLVDSHCSSACFWPGSLPPLNSP